MNLFCLNRFFLFATRMFIVRYSLIIKSDKKIHTLMVRRGKRTQLNEKIGANRLASILYMLIEVGITAAIVSEQWTQRVCFGVIL